MNSHEICTSISKALVLLAAPPTASEQADGWSPEGKGAAHKYLIGLKSALEAGGSLPPLGIVRGLDHWGVTGGELLEFIAIITNRARALGDHGAQL